jgi:Ca2+-binding EF-hand superfamily protein
MSTKYVAKPTKSQALSEDELEEMRQCFNLFDPNNSGKINPTELKNALHSFGYHERNPTIFAIVTDLADNPVNSKTGVDFETFTKAISGRLGNRDSEDAVNKIFRLFTSDSNKEPIDSADLLRIARELGEFMTAEELNDALDRISQAGNNISFQDFFNYMTRR